MNDERLSKLKENMERGIEYLEANTNIKFTRAERIIFISGYFAGRVSASEEIRECLNGVVKDDDVRECFNKLTEGKS